MRSRRQGHTIDPHRLLVDDLFGKGRVHDKKIRRGGMRQLDVHDMEFHGIGIPDAVDPGFVVETFEPNITIGGGRFARFDEYFGAGLGVAQYDENGGCRVFVEEGCVVRWDMDVEDADVFVFQHLMMPGLLAHLDLGRAPSGKDDECQEKEDLVHGTKIKLSQPCIRWYTGDLKENCPPQENAAPSTHPG